MQGGNAKDVIRIISSILLVIGLFILLIIGSKFFDRYKYKKGGEKFRKEGYRSGEGVLGTEAEARGITALTAHTPPVLRPYELR